MTPQPSFAALLEGFFTQRLMQQRQASRHTVASYRDTFRLLLQFAQQRLHKAPATLALEDIDAPLVAAFLNELEQVRGVTARTRNLRLTAVHSFFHYAAFEAPANAAQIQRVLAIPAKRFTRPLVPFLSIPPGAGPWGVASKRVSGSVGRRAGEDRVSPGALRPVSEHGPGSRRRHW